MGSKGLVKETDPTCSQIFVLPVTVLYLSWSHRRALQHLVEKRNKMGQREDPPEWWPWDWERCHLLLAATQGQCPGWWLGESLITKVIDVKSKGLGSVGFCMCAAGHEAEGQVFQKKQNFAFCGVISKGQHVWREIRLVVEMAECPYPHQFSSSFS